MRELSSSCGDARPSIALVRDWRRGLAGGLAAFVGYDVVIWAMTQPPIAAVAALRETSVVFAVIGVSCSVSVPCAARRRRAGHPRGHCRAEARMNPGSRAPPSRVVMF
jgi:hypothetical protein